MSVLNSDSIVPFEVYVYTSVLSITTSSMVTDQEQFCTEKIKVPDYSLKFSNFIKKKKGSSLLRTE
jgi:hypothetical protein